MTADDIEQIRRRRKRAHKEVADICAGRRRWTMCVPVQDHDSDRVICAALRDIDTLLDEVAALYDTIDGRFSNA